MEAPGLLSTVRSTTALSYFCSIQDICSTYYLRRIYARINAIALGSLYNQVYNPLRCWHTWYLIMQALVTEPVTINKQAVL